MNELQKYLFDLQGFLVIEDALTPDELTTLNQIVDRQKFPVSDRFQRAGGAAGSEPEGPGFLEWGQPFIDLLDHGRILPILRFQLGDCFRLDRLYAIFMRQGIGWGPLHADYGASIPHTTAQPGVRFHTPSNHLVSGFLVVSWNLADCGPEHGGFCCIPGSHKSDFKLPQEITDSPNTTECVVIPRAPAGSVTIFSEALTHGTAAWTAKHDRRAVLFKYCVSQMAWSSNRVQPPMSAQLTPRQKILFREPADPYRFFPSLFDD